MSLADDYRNHPDVVLIKTPGSDQPGDAADLLINTTIQHLQTHAEDAAGASRDFGRGFAYAIKMLQN